ncbi:DUF6557 family protein [Limosilactobacillus kribbianus]|uniref:DUF6557 family protein n=1 Tax=Limosilactobacillus kribbianus TaxID=2982695 RepID=UPI00226497AA|nr:DUF6557 family protein [Limosilactobacillus kribbianus]
MGKQVVTVYQAFKHAKHKVLINMYLDKYIQPRTLEKYGHKACKKQLKKYLKYILKQKPRVTEDDSNYVFFVSHKLDNDLLMVSPRFNLQRADQLGAMYPTYGYELTPMAETLGYLIIKTWRTKYYMNELLVDIMYEMSWFGYRQEGLKKEIHQLKKADKEIKKGKLKSSAAHNRKELSEMFGIDITDEDHFDRYEHQLQHEIIELSGMLVSHSLDREAVKVKKILCQVDPAIVKKKAN